MIGSLYVVQIKGEEKSSLIYCDTDMRQYSYLDSDNQEYNRITKKKKMCHLIHHLYDLVNLM